MPRSRGGSGGRGSSRAPSRPTAAPARQPAPTQQQSRSASTAARPAPGAGAQPNPGQQGKQPGLFGQMASTAAGVAVGSSIGHAIGGWFGGSAPQEQQDGTFAAQHENNAAQQENSWGPRSCETDAKSLTRCLDENAGNMQICNWYLEQLKSCQAAASQY